MGSDLELKSIHIKEGKKATESGVIGGEGGRIEEKEKELLGMK